MNKHFWLNADEAVLNEPVVGKRTINNVMMALDLTYYNKILANIPECEESEFLKLAATRHIRYDYSKIASYYEKSSQEMKDLMKALYLVYNTDITDEWLEDEFLNKKTKKVVESLF